MNIEKETYSRFPVALIWPGVEFVKSIPIMEMARRLSLALFGAGHNSAAFRQSLRG